MPPKTDLQQSQAPSAPQGKPLTETPTRQPFKTFGTIDKSEVNLNEKTDSLFKGALETVKSQLQDVKQTFKETIQTNIESGIGFTREQADYAKVASVLTPQQLQDIESGRVQYAQPLSACDVCPGTCPGCDKGVQLRPKSPELVAIGGYEERSRSDERMSEIKSDPNLRIDPQVTVKENSREVKADVVTEKSVDKPVEKTLAEVNLALIPAIPPVKAEPLVAAQTEKTETQPAVKKEINPTAEVQAKLLQVASLENKHREELRRLDDIIARRRFEKEEKAAQEKQAAQASKEKIVEDPKAKEAARKEEENSLRLEQRKAQVLETLAKIAVMKDQLQVEAFVSVKSSVEAPKVAAQVTSEKTPVVSAKAEIKTPQVKAQVSSAQTEVKAATTKPVDIKPVAEVKVSAPSVSRPVEVKNAVAAQTEIKTPKAEVASQVSVKTPAPVKSQNISDAPVKTKPIEVQATQRTIPVVPSKNAEVAKVVVTGKNVNRAIAPANTVKTPGVSKVPVTRVTRLGRQVAARIARNTEVRKVSSTQTTLRNPNQKQKVVVARTPVRRAVVQKQLRPANTTALRTARRVNRVPTPKRFTAVVKKANNPQIKKPLLNRVAQTRNIKNSVLVRPNRVAATPVKNLPIRARIAANLRQATRVVRKPVNAQKMVLKRVAKVVRTKNVAPLTKKQIKVRTNLKTRAIKTLKANRGRLNQLKKINVKAKTKIKTKLTAKVNLNKNVRRARPVVRKAVQVKRISLKTNSKVQLKRKANPELRKKLNTKVRPAVGLKKQTSTKVQTKIGSKISSKVAVKAPVGISAKTAVKTAKPVQVKTGVKTNKSKIVDKYLVAKKDILITKKLLKLTKNPQQRKFLKMKLAKLEEREADLLSFIIKSKKKTKLRINNSKKIRLHPGEETDLIVEENFSNEIRLPKKIKLYSEDDKLDLEDPNQEIPENLIQ